MITNKKERKPAWLDSTDLRGQNCQSPKRSSCNIRARPSCSSSFTHDVHLNPIAHLEQELIGLLEKFTRARSDVRDLQKFIYQSLNDSLEGLSLPIIDSHMNKIILERFSKTVNKISAIAMRTLHDLRAQNKVLGILDAFYIDEVLHNPQRFPSKDMAESQFALLTGRARSPVYFELDGRGAKYDFGTKFEFLPRFEIKFASQEALRAIEDIFSPLRLEISLGSQFYCQGDLPGENMAVVYPPSDLVYVSSSLDEHQKVFGNRFVGNLFAHEKAHETLNRLGFEACGEQSERINQIHEFIAHAVDMQVSPLQTFFSLVWTKLPSSYDLVAQRVKVLADDFLYKNIGTRFSEIELKSSIQGESLAELFNDFNNVFVKTIGRPVLQNLLDFVKRSLRLEAQQMIIKLHKQGLIDSSKLEKLSKSYGTSSVAS